MGVKTIKAIRGFYYDGKLVKAGDAVTVPGIFAIEVIAGNKAVEVTVEAKTEAKAEVKPKAETETKSAYSVQAQGKAGKGDVR